MIYLLGETSKQINFTTQVKFLYRSEFIDTLVAHLDVTGGNYYFLSLTHGILSPSAELSPYRLKTLSEKGRQTWGILAHSMITRFIPNDDKKICLLYSGGRFISLEKRLAESGYKIYDPVRHFSSDNLKLQWFYSKMIKA